MRLPANLLLLERWRPNFALIRVIFERVFHRTRSASLPGTSGSSRGSARSPGPAGTVPPSGACRRRRRPRTGPAPSPRADTGPGGRGGTARRSRTPAEAGRSGISEGPDRCGADPGPDFRVGPGRSGAGPRTGCGSSGSCGSRSCSVLLLTHLSPCARSGDASRGPSRKHLWSRDSGSLKARATL